MNTDSDQTPSSNRQKKGPLFNVLLHAGLILFGLSVALVIGEVALHFIRRTPAGSEFGSIDELRRAMLLDPARTSGHAPHGSVNLAAIINPHQEDKIIYDLRPNLSVKFQGVPVTSNKCGMRNRETPLAKPKDTYRIAFLGDSFTFGWGVPQEKAFPQVLEDILNGISHGHPKFEVLNFGVPGYSTFQEVALFKEKGADFDADAAIVFFIDNDFGMPFYIRDVYNPNKLLASSGLARLAEQALGHSDAPASGSHFDYDPNHALRDLADYDGEHGIQTFLAINPRKDWSSLLGRLWIMKSRSDIKLMDIRDDFMALVDRHQIALPTLTLPNDGHPSVIKHKLLGEVMAPYFMPVMQ